MGPETQPAPRRASTLKSVFRFAKPHWKALTLAFLLMSVESLTSAGRIVLFYPIVTRVLEVDPATTGKEGKGIEHAVETAKTQGGWLVDRLDDVVDGVNAMTSRWVPDSWVESSGAKAETAEARAAAREHERQRYATVLTVGLLFTLFIGVLCGAAYLESYVTQRATLAMMMDIREAVCTKVLDQPVAFYDQRHRGELVGRVLGDVGGYSIWLNLMTTSVVKGFLQIAFGVAAMVLVSWHLTLIGLLAVPFLIPMRRLMAKTLKRAHKRQQESVKVVEVLLQVFSGIRTVKAFGTEATRAAEFRRADEAVTRRSLQVQRAKSASDALTEFINNFLAMLLAVGGTWLILRGFLPVDTMQLILFLGLAMNLYQPLKRLVKAYNSLQDARASVERTTEYLDLPAGAPDAPGAVDFPGVADSIRFEHVGFSYVPGQPVLKDVSFEIPAGQTVALVGPSGGGKSTLCDLLLRFYDTGEGRLSVDGQDVRRFKRASFLSKCALVGQQPFLFHTSIRENIRQGFLPASDAEIEDAAKAASIHDHIVTLPRGYEEPVGEVGVRLSGGQRQRITIARALVRNPSILVLDEATSSLDTASEKAVQQAIDRLREGRTTLVVAHRLSTVQKADRIVVIDKGRVADQGTHEELIARGGLYADLVRMQDLTPASVDERRA
jgi:subfamily B ATP-binding cassette protein MsbA